MGTIGGKIGCAAAAAIGVPLFVLLGFLRFYGDCLDEPACHDGEGVAWLAIIGVTAAAAAAIGFGVRSIVNRLARRHRRQ
ncbi:MAG TPA: hypothetical protein VF702_06480 [Allosphingosinicella sp.]|jgi:drug/metabolite transporter (DMT)-like permease